MEQIGKKTSLRYYICLLKCITYEAELRQSGKNITHTFWKIGTALTVSTGKSCGKKYENIPDFRSEILPYKKLKIARLTNHFRDFSIKAPKFFDSKKAYKLRWKNCYLWGFFNQNHSRHTHPTRQGRSTMAQLTDFPTAYKLEELVAVRLVFEP